jgi:hypothetical protein
VLNGLSGLALFQSVDVLLVAFWITHWTWIRCLTAATRESAPDAKIASSFHRYRWLAVVLLLGSVVLVLASDLRDPYGPIQAGLLAVLIAQLLIGESGFQLQLILRRRVRR